MTKKELIKRLKKDLGIDIELSTLTYWERLGYAKPDSFKVWLNRKVKAYTDVGYQKTKENIIKLIKEKKIHPKGWRKVIKKYGI